MRDRAGGVNLLSRASTRKRSEAAFTLMCSTFVKLAPLTLACVAAVATACSKDSGKTDPGGATAAASSRPKSAATTAASVAAAAPVKSKKIGDAFMVEGAIEELRKLSPDAGLDVGPMSIVGIIVKTNYAEAPSCAVHPAGKADPPDCDPPMPRFHIADLADDTTNAIVVMGWVSSFAQMHDMILAIDKAPKGKEAEVKITDVFFGTDLPNPLPDVGARVKVTGSYGRAYTRTANKQNVVVNLKTGVMSADRIDYLSKPKTLVVLPGMKVSKQTLGE